MSENLYALGEAVATAVVHMTDRLRFEATAALAGMHLPRVRDKDAPDFEIVGWCGIMVRGPIAYYELE